MNKENINQSRFISRTGEPGEIHVLRLKSGSDLQTTLNTAIYERDIKAAVILSGVGLLSTANLRNCKSLPETFPITDLNRNYQTINAPCEILSLSGNVSLAEGKPLIHAHLTLSYLDEGVIRVTGGHLIPGCTVHGFAEIIIMELREIAMTKKYDEETKTLQLLA
jgi:predicted DNA-binding protein with PD1-like motif